MKSPNFKSPLFKSIARWLPKRSEILESRWLKSHRHLLQDRRLWRFERHSVAKAAAIGVFIGFMIPIAQFIAAAATAVAMRANISIAMAGTLVTNPLTFPPVYWLAYKVGLWVHGGKPQVAEPDVLSHTLDEALVETTGKMMSSMEWLHQAIDWLQGAGLPLVTGLAIFAVVGAISAYVLVQLGWHLRMQLRGMARRNRVQNRTPQ